MIKSLELGLILDMKPDTPMLPSPSDHKVLISPDSINKRQFEHLDISFVVLLALSGIIFRVLKSCSAALC